MDKIKLKIVLYDGQQNRFIYEHLDQKIIRIQGLAGTGKTELLLHKLKELYVNQKNSRIAFTCHNKVLSNSIHERIPSFFNFMKVEEQIEWNKRLYVFHAWGSKNNNFNNLGLYSLICNKYGITHTTYSKSNSFDSVCKVAFEQLKLKNI